MFFYSLKIRKGDFIYRSNKFNSGFYTRTIEFFTSMSVENVSSIPLDSFMKILSDALSLRETKEGSFVCGFLCFLKSGRNIFCHLKNAG